MGERDDKMMDKLADELGSAMDADPAKVVSDVLIGRNAGLLRTIYLIEKHQAGADLFYEKTAYRDDLMDSMKGENGADRLGKATAYADEWRAERTA